MPKDKMKISTASYLALMKDDKVLLLKRANSGFRDGEYSMIAGHLEPGETPAATLVREAEEEAGITIRLEDLRLAHIMYRERSSPDDVPYVDFYFECSRWQDEVTNKEPHKCAGLDWFSVDNLPSETIPYVRQAIECIRRGEWYSEDGW